MFTSFFRDFLVKLAGVQTIREFVTSVVCFFIFLSFFSQEPLLRKMSYLEGLPSQTIFDLFVDDKGLLFLGTDRGLYSYNGIEFKEYRSDRALGISINSIQQTKDGRLWCKNFSNQLFYLDGNQLKPHPEVSALFEDESLNLYEYKAIQNDLWLLTEKKVFKVNEVGEVKTIIEIQNPLPSDIFFSANYDPETDLIYIAATAVIYVLKNEEVIMKIPVESGQKGIGIFQGKIYYLLKGDKNEVRAITGEKIATGKLSDQAFFYDFHTTSDALWFGTTDGMHQVNTHSNSLGQSILRQKRINAIAEDHEGNLWISNLDEGLFFMPNTGVRTVEIEFGKLETTQNIKSLAIDEQGNLYAGTGNGRIVVFDTSLNQKLVYNSGSDAEIEHIFPYKNRIVTSRAVFEKGMESPIIESYFGKRIVTDHLGNFVIASSHFAGIFKENFDENPDFSEYPKGIYITNPFRLGNSSTEIMIFRNKRARSVYFDNENLLYYIAFNDALMVFDTKGNEFTINLPDGTHPVVNDFLKTEDGSLWLATSQKGLLELKDFEIINQITTKQGLSSNLIKRLQVDKSGLWILTDNGIDYKPFSGEAITNAGFNLGLKGVNINDFLVQNNHIWLATNEGLFYSDKQVLFNEFSPRFSISAFLTDGNDLQANSKLKYSNNSLYLQFNTISYKSLGNFTYEFMLEPYHSEWQQQLSTQPRVHFLSLAQGTYTFHGRIKSGQKYTDVETFTFTISKPFWLQHWFIILTVLLLSGLLVAVYRWAATRTRKKQEIKEQLALSQLTALRSQMNPHFLFNVMNAIQGLIYSNQKSKANEYMGTFSGLMRKTLDVSDKKEITIAEEISTIELYISLEKARFDENDFHYEIKLPDDEDLQLYTIPSLIIQPFVENAIKHGLMHKEGNKKLTISVERHNPTYWQFVIEDNGIGREASARINSNMASHRSFASQAIANRITLINKLQQQPILLSIDDLTNNHSQALGTRVNLLIPIIKQL